MARAATAGQVLRLEVGVKAVLLSRSPAAATTSKAVLAAAELDLRVVVAETVVAHGAAKGGGPPAKSTSTPIRWLNSTRLYVVSHDNISSEMMAGLELPPEAWLNEQLEKQGTSWRVRVLNGANFEHFYP